MMAKRFVMLKYAQQTHNAMYSDDGAFRKDTAILYISMSNKFIVFLCSISCLLHRIQREPDRNVDIS